MVAARNVDYRDELARLTPGLRQVARALVSDHGAETADDLVQATLVRALESDQGRRGDRLQLWLLSILIGLHRSHALSLKAEHQMTAGGRNTQAGAGRLHGWDLPRPPTGTAAQLGQLPLECREVLLLVVLAGLSYPQVAEAVGASINTVVARLARGRELLGTLGREGGAPPNNKPAKTNARTPSYLRVVK